MAQPEQRTSWFVKIVALAISALLGCVVVEVLIRVTGHDRPIVWQPDPVLGWWHRPNATIHWRDEGDGHVRINSLGMRDPERTQAKPAGVFRIAVFGDSMTEGVQVDLEQTFTQLLEARLKQRGLKVEVLNFGVNGYSPLQGYLLYRNFGKAFAPDLVIHSVFLDNDIADGDPSLATGQIGAPFVRPGESGELAIDYSQAEASYRDYHRQPMYAVRQLSAIYRMVSWFRWQRMNASRSSQAATAAAGGGIPKRYLVYADPLPQKWEQAFTTFARIEHAFATEVRAAGSTFAVLSMPAGQVVQPDIWQGVLKDFPAMTSLKWNVTGPEDRLRAIAAVDAVPLIVTTDRFRSRLGERPLFFGRIGHLTPDGHQVLENLLEESFASLGLVPGLGSSAGGGAASVASPIR